MSVLHPPVILSSADIPTFQAGKWLEIPLLIDPSEMEDLLATLSPIFLFKIGKIVTADLGNVDIKDFLKLYREYVAFLQKGEIREDKLFPLAFTKKPDHLLALQIEKDKYLLKIIRPVIQWVPHRIRYSAADRKFRSMDLGIDTITWGIYISFPILFQDPHSETIENTFQQDANGLCFRNLQRWVRANTKTVRFHTDGETFTTSIRLGKQCYSWIHHHPQLQAKQISVLP